MAVFNQRGNMSSIRCKFRCDRVSCNYIANGKKQWEYKFSAVYEQSEDNKKYWEAIPFGQLEFHCMKEGPLFIIGQNYYLDVSVAGVSVAVGAEGRC